MMARVILGGTLIQQAGRSYYERSYAAAAARPDKRQPDPPAEGRTRIIALPHGVPEPRDEATAHVAVRLIYDTTASHAAAVATKRLSSAVP
jgi:hypothetical protein